MKRTKQTKSYFKTINDEVKTLSYCVNHFDINSFHRDCESNAIGGNDYLLSEVLKPNTAFGFLEFCVKQDKLYLFAANSKTGYIVEDGKTIFSLRKISDLLNTLIVLDDNEEQIPVRIGTTKELQSDGTFKSVPIIEERTQIGIIILLNLWKAAGVAKEKAKAIAKAKAERAAKRAAQRAAKTELVTV